MKLSELNFDELSNDQLFGLVIKNVYYGTIDLKKEKDLKTAIVVLGATTDSIKERMLTAIELYKKGYGDYIVVTDEFEPKIKELEKPVKKVNEHKSHEAQTKMMHDIAEIFFIREEKMIYYSDDLEKKADERLATFDRFILITIIHNVKRAVQRCKKCHPNKKFEGCATMRDFSEWNIDMDEAKYKYSDQIKKEARNLIEYAKKGYIEDMDVDYLFEGGK